LNPTRILSIPGIDNLRDLGGYPTTDGRLTRWKVILRSATLERLPHAGQRKLIDYGLRTDIDLRSVYQRSAAPDVFEGSKEVDYRPLAFFDEPSFEDRLERLPSTADAYWLMLTERGLAVRAVMEAIAGADGLTLIHCAAGKDRTGLICALLLGIAGVPDDLIVEDYALSQTILTDPASPFRRMYIEQEGLTPAEYDAMLKAEPETMRDILRKFHQHFGGLTGYLKAIGLSEAALRRLRARLVDGPGGAE